MKGFGILHIFKNREIALSGFEEVQGQLTKEEIMRARNKERQDISFIDSASAILSRGGGMGFSVKASAIDALSLLTPPTTNPSVASSVFGTHVSNKSKSTQVGSIGSKHELKPLKKDALWRRYKEKNEAAVRRHDEKVSRSIPHKQISSISSPRHDIQVEGCSMKKLNNTLEPTTIPDLPYPGSFRRE